MSTQYHIYSNNGAGGPVNYTTIVATTAALSYNTAGLAEPSNTTFAVRAYDTVSGLEEQNVDARVRIVVDASGNDLTGLPNAPILLTATATKSGTARVTWSYATPGQGGFPQGFHVYAGTPTPSYTTPVLTVVFTPSTFSFVATLTGLVDGTTYQVCVRSYNNSGEESNTNIASVTGDATGPLPVANLLATVIS